MNKLHLRLLALAVLVCFCLAQCTKDQTPSNLILYNKPFSVILSSIRGKWRVQYAYGGTCSTCKYDRFNYNEYYIFGPKSKVIYICKDSLVDDTTYKWISYQSSSTDYVHHIIEPYQLEPVKISNYTLVLARPFFGNPD
jgi:hypothetical protein